MFQVVHKETGEIRTVYGRNGQYFLFWSAEQECWEYGHRDDYSPIEVHT